MGKLIELAELCERAMGPDRELDEAIQTALLSRPSGKRYDYTASLDAAKTLVPKGWHVGCITECDEDDYPSACLTENEEPCHDAVGRGVDMTLSLCAAALRARSQSTPDILRSDD